jgi:hypothetical protein
MSRAIKTSISGAIVAALFAGLLVGSLSTATAEEPQGDLGLLDTYTRGKTYTCTSDIFCIPGEIIIRCKAGDYATGGAAWRIDNPGGFAVDYQSRPWRKNGGSRGWMTDGADDIGPDDRVRVEVICIG